MRCAAGRVGEAFEVFEWMVAGYGAEASVPASRETYAILLRGCHEAGALEKALEVFSWMSHTNIKPTLEMYTELEATLDIAKLWDKKVFAMSKAAGADDESEKAHGAILPQSLRPAPYDGIRALYTNRPDERIEVRSSDCICCSAP